MRFLSHGRVVDTTRLRETFGYIPKYTTLEAFDDFVAGRQLSKIVSPELVGRAERRAVAMITGGGTDRA